MPSIFRHHIDEFCNSSTTMRGKANEMPIISSSAGMNGHGMFYNGRWYAWPNWNNVNWQSFKVNKFTTDTPHTHTHTLVFKHIEHDQYTHKFLCQCLCPLSRHTKLELLTSPTARVCVCVPCLVQPRMMNEMVSMPSTLLRILIVMWATAFGPWNGWNEWVTWYDIQSTPKADT